MGSEPSPHPRPLIIVISGPSGVGKTVICRRLIESDPSLVLSVSATTRPPRFGEVEGVNYFFWTEDQFRDSAVRGFFLEWAQVHDHLYGTPRAAVEALMAEGKSPVLDVDVQGGRSVKKLMPEAVLIMLTPPSLEALEARLRGRGTDTDAAIERRLKAARRELDQAEHYDHLVVNDTVEEAVEEIRRILEKERSRAGSAE